MLKKVVLVSFRHSGIILEQMLNIFTRMLMVCLQCIVVSITGHLMGNGRDVKTRYGDAGSPLSVGGSRNRYSLRRPPPPPRNRPATYFHSGNIVFKKPVLSVRSDKIIYYLNLFQ